MFYSDLVSLEAAGVTGLVSGAHQEWVAVEQQQSARDNSSNNNMQLLCYVSKS